MLIHVDCISKILIPYLCAVFVPFLILYIMSSFKYGTKPVMELTLANWTKHSLFLWVCFAIWVLILLYTFLPILYV